MPRNRSSSPWDDFGRMDLPRRTNGRYGSGQERRSRRSRMPVRLASLAALLLIVTVVVVIRVVSESWWLGTVLTFAPRWYWVIVAAAVAGVTAYADRRWCWLGVLSLVLSLVGVMEIRLPWRNWDEPPAGKRLTVVSCNVQRFKPDFRAVLQEIVSCSPDIVALQEAFEGHPLLASYFPGWHSVQAGEFWVGSRYPVRLVGTCHAAAFNRPTAVAVEIALPEGRIRLFTVHQSTPRGSLAELNLSTLMSGEASARIEEHISLRDAESEQTRAFVEAHRDGLPTLVVGDFNMPTTDSLFQKHWGDLTSSFDTAGCGFGCTSPCRPQPCWPVSLPWLRIDHILSSSDWSVVDCTVGRSNGSDHRMIAATVVCLKRQSGHIAGVASGGSRSGTGFDEPAVLQFPPHREARRQFQIVGDADEDHTALAAEFQQ